VTYVAPREEKKDLFHPFSAEYPLTLRDSQMKVTPRGDAEVLATITLPYTDPKGTKYAAMLTDPPGVETQHPSVVLNRHGKGKVIYSAGVFEIWQHESQRRVLADLLKLVAKGPFCYETDAPTPVEVALFDQEDRSRYVVHVLNYQQELPNIPIRGIRLSIGMDGKTARRLVRLPEEEAIEYTAEGDRVRFTLPELRDYVMLALEYGPGSLRPAPPVPD
jgi:hypothetical protein